MPKKYTPEWFNKKAEYEAISMYQGIKQVSNTGKRRTANSAKSNGDIWYEGQKKRAEHSKNMVKYHQLAKAARDYAPGGPGYQKAASNFKIASVAQKGKKLKPRSGGDGSQV